jgi:hypothetical protein
MGKKERSEVVRKAAAAGWMSENIANPPRTFTILLNQTEETFAVYANSFDVTTSFHDVTLSFGRIPPKITEVDREEAIKRGGLEVDASVQITISPQILPQLIKALNAQRAIYEQNFGQLKELP